MRFSIFYNGAVKLNASQKILMCGNGWCSKLRTIMDI